MAKILQFKKRDNPVPIPDINEDLNDGPIDVKAKVAALFSEEQASALRAALDVLNNES